MSDDTTEYMGPFDFAAKIDWEGGIVGALDYGLQHTELDPDDDASITLRDAWRRLEHVYRGAFTDRVSEVREALEKVSDENGGTPA